MEDTKPEIKRVEMTDKVKKFIKDKWMNENYVVSPVKKVVNADRYVHPTKSL